MNLQRQKDWIMNRRIEILIKITHKSYLLFFLEQVPFLSYLYDFLFCFVLFWIGLVF